MPLWAPYLGQQDPLRQVCQMSTGWFGIPGKTSRIDIKVHVYQDGKTLCGWKPSPGHRFQWCAHFIVLSMVDCIRCRATSQKILDKIAKLNSEVK
jgi:hypothetical protein